MKPELDRLQRQVMQHRLPVFVTAIIVMAIILVAISMQLYYKSDAFRLDLSRPEYKPLRPQIAKDSKKDKAFEAQGAIDTKTMQDFLERYNAEAQKVTDSQPFVIDVLSDEQLGIAE